MAILAVNLLRRRAWGRIATLGFNALVASGAVLSEILVIDVRAPAVVFALVAFEAVIAACLCTPTARRWFA